MKCTAVSIARMTSPPTANATICSAALAGVGTCTRDSSPRNVM